MIVLVAALAWSGGAEDACAGGDLDACVAFGRQLQQGGGPDAAARAVGVFSAACDGGSATGCANAGILRQHGPEALVDLVVAASLYRRGCAGDSRTACQNLGWLYEHGAGVPEDPHGALGLYDQACALGAASACSAAGWVLATGFGDDPRYRSGALPAFERGCQGGASEGCLNVGQVYGMQGDGERAVMALSQACDLDNARGCFLVGVRYETGSGVVADPERARLAFTRGCALGDPESCAKTAAAPAGGGR